MAIEAAHDQRKRPFWRRLLRGLAFIPAGIPLLLLFTWLFGSTGTTIGVLGMLAMFVEGYSGRSLAGAASGKAPASLPAGGADAAAGLAPPTPPTQRHIEWSKIAASLVCVFIAVAVLFTVYDPGVMKSGATADEKPRLLPSGKLQQPSPPPKKETLADRVGGGTVERAGDWIIVRQNPGTVWSAKWYFIEAGQLLERIGRWASEDVSGRIGAKKLILQVWPVVTDQYGKEGRSMVLALEVDPAEFGKINWGNFSGDRMLNLVEIQQLWPSMVPAVIEYCKDRGQTARQFCQQAERFMR